jgi:hypothetical protein
MLNDANIFPKYNISKDVIIVSCSSTLKMEAICSSEMSAEFRRTRQCYTPRDEILHRHR